MYGTELLVVILWTEIRVFLAAFEGFSAARWIGTPHWIIQLSPVLCRSHVLAMRICPRESREIQRDSAIQIELFSAWSRALAATSGRVVLLRGAGCSPTNHHTCLALKSLQQWLPLPRGVWFAGVACWFLVLVYYIIISFSGDSQDLPGCFPGQPTYQ